MKRRREAAAGFTLIELLISISILTIVIGAITTAMIVYFEIGRATSERDDHSGGTDVAVSYLNRDLASAEPGGVTVGGSVCSNATNVFSLAWTEWTASTAAPTPTPGPNTYTVAYRLAPDVTSAPPGGGSRYQVERWFCPAGGGPSSTVLVGNLVSTAALAVSTAPLSGCTSTPLTVTLARYAKGPLAADSDAGSDYSFTGCLGGRKR